MMFLRNSRRLKHLNELIANRYNKICMCNQFDYPLCTAVNTKVNVTVGDFFEYWRHRFEIEAISEPIESIQHILSHVMGIRKCLELANINGTKLSEMQANKLETLCLRRLSRMPVQYIIGEWTFRDIEIKLVPPIFIPRSETEILVDLVIEQIFDENRSNNLPINVLEIGCGSGAISLAILHSCRKNINVECIAIDESPHACKLANDNTKKLGLDNYITILNAKIEEDGQIILASGEHEIDFAHKQFDIIVSNPPYIPTNKINELSSDIRVFEDIKALDGGADGLNVIESIMKYASIGLKPYGHLFMEVDTSHPKSIQSFISKFVDMRLKYEQTYKDYCNSDRFVQISKIGQFFR